MRTPSRLEGDRLLRSGRVDAPAHLRGTVDAKASPDMPNPVLDLDPQVDFSLPRMQALLWLRPLQLWDHQRIPARDPPLPKRFQLALVDIPIPDLHQRSGCLLLLSHYRSPRALIPSRYLLFQQSTVPTLQLPKLPYHWCSLNLDRQIILRTFRWHSRLLLWAWKSF